MENQYFGWRKYGVYNIFQSDISQYLVVIL